MTEEQLKKLQEGRERWKREKQEGNIPAQKKLTPMRAIRAKCLECCCGSAFEVKLCEVKSCPLYDYRLGKKSIGKTNTNCTQSIEGEDFIEDDV